MVHEVSKVDDLTSSLSPAHNNVASGISVLGTDVSDSLLMDVVPIQIVSPTDHEVEETVHQEGESLTTGVPDDGEDVDEEEKAAAEEEGGDEELYAEEDNVYFNDESDEEEDVHDDDFMEEDNKDEHGWAECKVDVLDESKEARTTKGESGKKEIEEKGAVSMEPKVEKLKKKNKVIKKAVRRNLDKVIVKNKDKLEEDEKNDPMDKEKGNKKEEVQEKGEKGLTKNVKRSSKGDRKKVIIGSSEKAASQPKDNLNLKHRKKGGSERAESMGMIFMCSSKTKKDCYRYQVLGLPAGKRDIVEKIYKGMRLFLFDVDLKLLYGIYKAAGRGGYNIEPKAFNYKFPSQVRFTVLEDCVPLAEEKFRKVIKDNYFTKNKFDCQLKHEQVKNLCKLFVAASKGPKSKRLDRNHKAKLQASIHRDRSRAQGADERRHSGLDENYRHHDYFHVRQREVVASPALVSQVSPLPPPIAAPRYAYDRTSERDAYRKNILVDHRDPYRQPPFVSQDAYRRQSPSEYPNVHRQEPLLDYYDGYRRDGVPKHRDLRPINLPVRHRDGHDPHGFHRERQPYHETVNIGHLSGESNRYHPVPTEYRPRGAPISPDYRYTRTLYRY